MATIDKMKVCSQSGCCLLTVPDAITDADLYKLIQSKSSSIEALQCINFEQREPCITARDVKTNEVFVGFKIRAVYLESLIPELTVELFATLGRDIQLALLAIHGYALKYASDELKGDRLTVLTAVQNRGSALSYASDELKRDRKIVMAAVQNHGYILGYNTSTEFRNDRDLVLAAVQTHGFALYYASDELKGDREVVLAAMRQDRFALSYASPALQVEFGEN